MGRKCMRDQEERGPRSSLRLKYNDEDRLDNRKVRKRPANRHPSPSADACEGMVISFEVESDDKKSISTPLHQRDAAFPFQEYNLPDNCTSVSTTICPHSTTVLEQGDLVEENTILMGSKEKQKMRNTRRKKRGNTNYHLPSRVRTLKHRLTKLNQFFRRKEEKNSMKKTLYSFDVIVVMFSFRYMSRSQFRLDRDYDGPLIPNPHINIELVKTLIYQIIRWMHDNKFIQIQPENYQLPLHSYDDSYDASSVQNSFSNDPDSCTYSTDSSIGQNEICLDLSDYIAPEYVQIFLKSLDETTDLTPDYIHAHNRVELHDIENDDDGMSEEFKNLRFVEIKIEKELIDIDAQHAAEVSTEKLIENTPIDFEYMNSTTATDDFYNAFVAITSDSSSSSEEDMAITIFDVQNARETVLKLVNQIQSQFSQNNPDEIPQDSPQVQQRIMNDLLILSQSSKPSLNVQTSQEIEDIYEIEIDLKTSVSSMTDDDGIDDHCAPIAIERSDSIEHFTDEKTCPILNQSSEGIDMDLFPDSYVAVQVDRDEYHETFCRPLEVDQGMLNADDNSKIPGRTRKTIWTTLLDRRQKSTQKSDRRSPFPPKVMVSNAVSSYLQFRKERGLREINQDNVDDNSSIGTANSLEAECKYFLHENIRESHENNDCIEVILKDNFEISRMEDTLSPVTNCPDQSNAFLSKQSSNFNCTGTVPNTKTEMVSQDMKTIDFGERENISYINRIENAVIDIHCMHDEKSSKTVDNYLGDIAWSLSPIIDPFSNTSDTTPSLTGYKSPKIEFPPNKSVNTQSINSDAVGDSKSIVSVTNDKILQCVKNSDNIEKDSTRIQTEGLQKAKEVTMSPRSPKIFDYWQTLLTHSFSPTFEENIANEPIYVVHSTDTNLNSELIKNDVDMSIGTECGPILKDDPSGRYSLADYSDTTLDSNISKGYDSACGIGETPKDIEGTYNYASSEFDGSIDDRCANCDEYNPFEAARKIPEVYSEADSTLEYSGKSRLHDSRLCSGSATDNYEQPILSNITDSVETIYFDTDDVILCLHVNTSFGDIEVSGTLPSSYYTLPSVSYSNE